ncbi:ATP-binding cassette domain-containing protein [Paenibacillus sp. MMS20-IR301]|uniref:ABC transporter ATP-binding protein n=1 Tax=Paenibacillus sp. MMS20-IR301 TaxID=2895946 RepID=UPI0028E7E30D|nr:ATP-binding cassette domain-containing protein [Paenibacillus sp. MMS20-IR301]WNS41176.1 ATP-binding cassette domain-containing protein [Paenibacillus sp. MMS20-IR301]
MSDSIVKVDKVSKKMGRKMIINETSFVLEKGKIYGFIGPNGAGKTTLMRMITGLIEPSGGQIQIDSFDLKKERSQALARIGAIIESPVFFDYMTGKQVLRNLSRLHPEISSSDRDAHINKILKSVGLLERCNDRVKTYSLGMKQRLGIAQALLGNPQLLLLDEPSNGLDPMGMHELRKIIFNLRDEKGLTFLVSSHLLDELQQMCDQLIILREGTIIWNGKIGEMVSDGRRLEESFIELMQS